MLYQLLARTTLSMTELRLLTWGQAAALPPDLFARLGTPGEAEAYVFSTASGKPYDVARFSRLVKKALEEAGFPDMSFREYRTLLPRMDAEEEALTLAQRPQGVAAAELPQSAGVLRAMAKAGRLRRIGHRYYLPSAVPSGAELEGRILAHLHAEGFAYRQDIARLLGLSPAQTRTILMRMVASGALVLQSQRYTLPK